MFQRFPRKALSLAWLVILLAGCLGINDLYLAHVRMESDRPEENFSRQNFTVGNADGEIRLEASGNATGQLVATVRFADGSPTALGLDLHPSGEFNGTQAVCLQPGTYMLVAQDKGFTGRADAVVLATYNHTACPVFKTKTDVAKTVGNILGWVGDHIVALGSIAGAVGTIVTTTVLLKGHFRKPAEPHQGKGKRPNRR